MSEVDFGTRTCQICKLEVPAGIFGAHVANAHGMEAVATQWPGGLAGFLRFLIDSVEQSIRRSEGYPELIRRLEVSKGVIKQELQEQESKIR